MNVIEFHTWNAVKTAIEKPDRLILDLDPGEGVSWQTVQQAAQLVRVLLQGVGLEGWLKTSGGKGLHVVVPLRRQYAWDVVKGFSAAMLRYLARTLPQSYSWPRVVPQTASARSSLIISATVSAPRRLRPGRRARGLDWASQCPSRGMNWGKSPAALTGRSPTFTLVWMWRTRLGTYTPQSISKAMAAINYVPTLGKR